MLSVRRTGAGPPVVALHGFTLTGEQFAPAAQRLSMTVIAPDLPGHGASTDAPTTIEDAVASVVSVVASVGTPVPTIGYSQGGRLALMAALDHPEHFSALVVISANAGIEDPDLRRARARTDAALAVRLRETPLAAFIDTWTSSGITSTGYLDPASAAADREIRMHNTPEGLADAVVGYGQGAQPSLWHRLTALAVPTLVMSGSRDAAYTAIGGRLVRTIPNAQHITIEGAGHNPLLEAPEIAYGAISDFLDRHR